MKRTKISQEWVIRSFSNELTDSERQKLIEWLESDPENRSEYNRLKIIWDSAGDIWSPSGDIEAPWQRFLDRIHREAKPKRNRRLVFYRVAASLVLVLGMAATLIWLIPKDRDDLARLPVVEPERSYIITPGGQKVVLADTQTEIRYDSLLAGQSVITGVRDSITGEAPVVELVVPRSRRIRLVLADGSRICLNSESRLRYPEFFTGKTRNVSLEGEAFFEITHDEKRPFQVNTQEINVSVLGTTFTVTAYPDEQQTSATLVEGSVALRKVGSTETQLLKPNQRAVYSTIDQSLTIKETDTELYTSWIHNYLKFSSESLEQVVQKLVRNYGVPMKIMDPSLREFKFSGKLDLQETVYQVLDVIQLVAPLNYREENGTILILNKDE